MGTKYIYQVLNEGSMDGRGRKYDLDELYNRIRERIDLGTLFGQLGPESSTTVSLDKASHKVISVDKREDGALIVGVELLDTPCGRIAQKCPRDLRGALRLMGAVDEDNNVSHVQIIAIDLAAATEEEKK